MKNFWNRWDVNYFSTLYEKMLNRNDIFSNRLYMPKEAFNVLNYKYKKVFGKERYKNFDSFKSARNKKQRK